MKSIEETMSFIAEIEKNELYKKSRSLHKNFQLRQFSNPATGELINGIQIREEDKNGLVASQEGFDPSSARKVTYNFKDGVLQSENNEPAIQYEGHKEIWEEGYLKKVIADNGDTEEYWSNGVPVRIESNILERRTKGEKIE